MTSRAYIAFLLTAVHALDSHFQAAAKKVCDDAGGDCKAPAPKGYMRMLAKMITDHAEAKRPKAAENIDTNRVAWTFDDPAQLCAAFEGASKTFGPPLRVKNGYSKDFNALEISKGYRNILANHRYAPEGLTWGRLAKNLKVTEAWDRLRDLNLNSFLRINCVGNEEALDPDYSVILKDLDAARSYFSSQAMQGVPVVLVVEIQYMLRPYLEMRKYTHSWYKIVRAESTRGMVSDFNS